MKVAPGIGNIEIRDIPVPEPGPGEVKLKVHAAGLGKIDLQTYHDAPESCLPIVLGHEVAGEVVELGQKVDQELLHSRVTYDTSALTHSRPCRSESSNLSQNQDSTRWAAQGGFAEYLVVPAPRIHRLPEHISYREGAIIEPLACVVHSVLLPTPTVGVGDLAVIWGPSTIGLLTLQILKASHSTVVVLGSGADSGRLTIAKDLGADYVANVEARDIPALIQDVSIQGLGADVVYECSGTETAAQQLLYIVRRGGRYVQIGRFGKSVQWDMDQICDKELTVTGRNRSSPESWIRAIHLLTNNSVKTGPLITHEFSLSQWSDAFEVFAQNRGVKVLFRPHFE